jgi:Skp family chaperone for outer membrane proteins
MKNRVITLGLGAVWLLAVSMTAAAMGQAAGAPAQTPPVPVQAEKPAQAAPQPDKAPPTGGNKVATVHIQRAIGECAEGKKAGEDLTKRFQPKKDELERKGAEIQALQKKLQDGDKLMTDEQKAQLARDIDRKTKDFNRDNDDAQADYQQALDQIVNAIGARMLQVVGVYAQKNGYDLVLNSANPGEVLWQTGRVDITDEIIGAYNMTFGTAGALSAPPTAPSGAPRNTLPQTKPSTPATPPATKKP